MLRKKLQLMNVAHLNTLRELERGDPLAMPRTGGAFAAGCVRFAADGVARAGRATAGGATA